MDPASIDLAVERNELTVRAERRRPHPDGADLVINVVTVINERPTGAYTWQMVLGESLDTERLEARYDGGALTIHVPVAEQAKPRKVEIASDSQGATHVTGG